jgi:hypothetical protein
MNENYLKNKRDVLKYLEMGFETCPWEQSKKLKISILFIPNPFFILKRINFFPAFRKKNVARNFEKGKLNLRLKAR